MARWFQNNWSVGAGILLASGIIFVFSLFTHRDDRPYTGLTEAPAVWPGLNSRDTATQPLKEMGLLACADVQQPAIHGCQNTEASHPLEILFDGQNNRVFEARSDSLPATDTLKTDPFIDSGDPRIQDLMSGMSEEQDDRVLIIKY